MLFTVTGFDRESQTEVTFSIEASSEAAAYVKLEYEFRHIDVSTVTLDEEVTRRSSIERMKADGLESYMPVGAPGWSERTRRLLVAASVMGVVSAIGSLLVTSALLEQVAAGTIDWDVVTPVRWVGHAVWLLYWIPFLMLMYRFWTCLPPGVRRTTPGKAVGYTFIPIFNIYWIFILLVGFAGDFRGTLRNYSVDFTAGYNTAVVAAVVTAILMIPWSVGLYYAWLTPIVPILQLTFAWMVLRAFDRSIVSYATRYIPPDAGNAGATPA
jgi:hypothetical protein